MSAFSQTFAITDTNTGSAYDLSANQIVTIVENGTGSTVSFLDQGATLKTVVVDESPATINTDCQMTIKLTDALSNDIWVNANRIIDVQDYITSTVNAKVMYDYGGTTPKIFYTTQTRAQIRTAISLIVQAAAGSYAEVTVENTWTVGQIFAAPNFESLAAAVSAYAGGGQGSATALTKRYNNVTTCTTAGDSVKLLTAAVGLFMTVKNNGATTLAVFPFSGDTINGGSANASVDINPGDSLTFVATTVNNWETEGVESLDTFFFATDLLGAKEVNHTMSVGTTTTAATVGGSLTIVGGAGATSGAGGALALAAGAGGATAGSTGGALTLVSGASGAGAGPSGVTTLKTAASTGANVSGALTIASGSTTSSGVSGAVTINSGTSASGNSGAFSFVTGAVATSGNSGAVTVGSGASSTSGNSGVVTISTGNAASGDSGNIVFTPGTASGVVGLVVASKAMILKHTTAAINATATATAKEVATGYITSTSALATTITLPTGTLLGGALGAAQGTIHDLFIDNSAGANTVTIAVAVNGILSSGAAAEAGGLGLLTVASGVTGIACFRLMFTSATAYCFSRIA